MRWWVLGLALIHVCGCSEPTSRVERTVPTAVPTAASSAQRVAVIEGFVADDGKTTDADTRVVEAVRELGDSDEEKTALFALFRRLRAHTVKAQHRGLLREVSHRLLGFADPRWEPDLVAMLEVPVVSLQRSQRKAQMDQVYWQVTAAEILGELGSAKAVKPLLRTVLSPFKVNIAPAARVALVRIGKPALELTVQLLEGAPSDLVRYAEAELRRAAQDEQRDLPVADDAKRMHLAHAVRMLGELGTADAKNHLLAASKSSVKWLRQLAAEQFPRVPKDAAIVKRFLEVLAETVVDDTLPGGESAKLRLIESSAWLFEPSVVSFVLEDALTAEHSQAVKAAALDYGMAAADEQSWPLVERLYAEVIARANRPDRVRHEKALAATKAMLAKCGDDAGCHADELAGVGPEALPALRGAHRLVLLGGTKQQVVELALSTANNSARRALAAAILTLCPAGDRQSGKTLEAAYEASIQAGDRPRTAALQPLLSVAAVLHARSHP